jgi:hypothetical protein
VVGALNYVVGWGMAAAARAPRAEPEVRAYIRDDQLRRLRRRVARELRLSGARS